MMLNFIINTLAALCVIIPAYNFIPYHIPIKNKIVFFIIYYTIDCLLYYKIDSYINLINIPLFFILVTATINKFKLVSFLLGVFGYMFSVFLNNLIIMFLFCWNINIFTVSIEKSILFQICFVIVLYVFTFMIGKHIKQKRNLIENFEKVCNTLKKKFIITLTIMSGFYIYIFLIIFETVGNNITETVVKNVIIMSIIFFFITVLFLKIIEKVYKEKLEFDKKVEKMVKTIDMIQYLDEKSIVFLRHSFEKEDDQLAIEILENIISNKK